MTEAPESVSGLAREPKQERSRVSFERMTNAARQLFMERGFDGFTLQEVSRLSGVSIGSIYGRVDSKDDLVMILLERTLADLQNEQSKLVDPARWENIGLADLVTKLFPEIAEMLKRHAPILRPMMMRASTDLEVGAAGKASFMFLHDNVLSLILARREAITHPSPERAAHSAFTAAYSTFARYLGLGSSLESSGEGDWGLLKEDVALMCARFLTR